MDDTEQSSSRQRLFLSLGVLLLLLLGVAAYFFFRSTNGGSAGTGERSFLETLIGGSGELPVLEPSTGQPSGAVEEASTREREASRLSRISDEPVIGATTVVKDDKVKYFKTATGHLFQNSFTGDKEERISNITIPAILDAFWSPSKEYAVLSYYDDGVLKKFYSHYKSTTTIESGFLPREIMSIAPSPAAESIAYIVPVGAGHNVITARPNNTGVKTVLPTPIADLAVSWAGAKTLGLQTRGSAFAPSTLYALDVSSGVLTKILESREGLDTLWSPDGARLLFSETRTEGRELTLNTLTTNGWALRTLNIRTLPEKCVWSAKEAAVLFCSVPTILPPAGLPDDWWQGNTSFNDALWKVNGDTGEAAQILSPYQLDAVRLFLSGDESYIFFTNKKDGLLWSYRLSE